MDDDGAENQNALKADPGFAISPKTDAKAAIAKKPLSRTTSMIILGIVGAILIFVIVAEPSSIPYRLAGAFNGALFGAIGGGVGAALEYLAKRRFTGKYLAVGAFLGLVLSHGFEEASNSFGDHVYKSVVEPKVDAMVVANDLISDHTTTVYKTLHDYEPKIFNAMVSDIVGSARSMTDVETSINAMRAKYIEPLIARKAIYLSDDDVERYTNLVIREMQTYETRKPELCVAALRGKPLGDVRPYLDPEEAMAELGVLEAAIKADSTKPWPVASSEEQNQFFQVAISQLGATFGENVQLFQATSDATGKETWLCKMGAELFRQISALPAPNNARMMRAMIASGSQ